MLYKFLINGSKSLVYVFAAIGVLDTGGRIVIFPFVRQFFGNVVGLPKDIEIHRVEKSDDGSVKAIVFLWTGNGFDPGCSEFVSIVKRAVAEQTAWGTSNRVFQHKCPDTGDTTISWEPPADGRVRPRLRIHTDPTNADLMSRSGLDETVSVAYPNDL